MATFTTIPLSQFFGLFAPKFLIGTTYTASLAFFESVVLPEIDRTRLNGAVIVVDEFGFANATTEASALVDVTTTYSMVLAPHDKSFHAKVWIMATDDEFALLCGSGNLTHSGFIGNHELFDVLRFRPGGDQRELAGEIAAFLEALANLFKGFDQEAVPARKILSDCSESVRRVAARQLPSASREIVFLSSFGGNFPEQIAARIGNGIRKVQVASPFFGGGYKGLDLIRSHFPGTKLDVFPALHGPAIDLPHKSAGEARLKLKLWEEKKSFAHFKLYGFNGDNGTWLFNGSANCTEQALGGANVEAGILRKVPETTLAFYFEPDGPLSNADELKTVWSRSATHWLRLWAVNTGAGIRLSLEPANATDTPLNDVRVELQSGSQSTSALFPRGFIQTVWSLSWGQLPKRPESPNCLTVKVTGTDLGGRHCEGVAFVDDTGMLNSSPFQRTVRAGVQTILTSNAIPSLAELGAVFELVGIALDAREVSTDPNERAPAKQKASANIPKQPEPIWPPRPGIARTSGSGWGSSNDSWFQKMLEGLLTGPRLADLAEYESADLDNNKKPKQPSKKRQKVAQMVFDLARERMETFCRRVHSMVPDEELAERLMPVAAGYFHLSQRAWEATHTLRPEAGAKELVDLTVAYTKALFDRRVQSKTYSPAFNSVYRHQMFPPLVWDIQHRYNVTIHPSLVPYNVAIFAFLKARGGTSFSRRQWLTFRSAAELRGFDAALKVNSMEAAVRLFSDGDNVEPLRIDLSTALSALDELNWRTETAYSALYEARQKHQTILGVDPHQRFCPNDGCPHISSPEFDGLSSIGVVECPHCRNVLTPFQLYEAFSFDHGL